MQKKAKPRVKRSEKPAESAVIASPTIVGIGASAGGLEALEIFFSHVPIASGLAFVVIQHLDPHHKGMMPELLDRSTPMKVVQAANQTKALPDCVYVIPPNKDLSILHGVLYLIDCMPARGLRLPIDFFFNALADDQREHAVAIILSGMGSDGTEGFRAIKASGGLTMTQSAESATFDSMPNSAIASGLADIIAPVEELPKRLTTFLALTHYTSVNNSRMLREVSTQEALAQVIIVLRKRCGNDFSLYKENTLYRRLERRMGLHQIKTLKLYTRFLLENEQEQDLLFHELLIGVTSFFRDVKLWEKFRAEILPAYLAQYPEGKELRAWVPACSTGEEAYSLAMAYRDVIDKENLSANFTLQIFATDLNEEAINVARLGIYSLDIENDVPPQQLSKYFIKGEKSYTIKKVIRGMVIFATHNIILDPPFTKLDFLSCRNLMIYLKPELQQRLVPLFHYILKAQGILILGSAETVGKFNALFKQVDKELQVYICSDHTARLTNVDFPARILPPPAFFPSNDTGADPLSETATTNLKTQSDQLLLNSYTPTAVLINPLGDILYINGRSGKYLEPAAGKANWNIHAMAQQSFAYQLEKAIEAAPLQKEPVHLADLEIDYQGGKQHIDLTVQSIVNPEALSGLIMVVFTDVRSPLTLPAQKGDKTDKAAQAELQQAHHQVQALREKMQSSQEELKSTNEEMQSTNEELQSTNEELTTSKEEMQSMNEELQTLNAELQSKVDALSCINNDMNNLLNSTEIATIFLDNKLLLRRFTPHATHIFKLILADIGRPLSDIVNELDYDQLTQDAENVLQTLMYIEKEVPAKNDRWFKVRIMPYRTQEDVIAGVVMTFSNISQSKLLEDKLRELNAT